MYIVSVLFLCSLLVFKFMQAIFEEKYLGMIIWMVAIFALVNALNNVPVG